MTSKDLHTAILDSNFTVGKRYIGRCSQVYRGKKAIHVACSETYTKVTKNGIIQQINREDRNRTVSLAPHLMFLCKDGVVRSIKRCSESFINEQWLQKCYLKFSS